jgi:anti-sigma factor RsiW
VFVAVRPRPGIPPFRTATKPRQEQTVLEFTDEQVQSAAERYGLVEQGQRVPRTVRSKVVAMLANELRAEKAPPAPAAPRMAREVVLQPGGQILLDGQPFPWLVAEERIDIVLHPEPGGVSTVRMTLLAESVRIIKPNESETIS